MTRPSRWIAPLALLAALLAVWLVIQGSTGDSDDGGGSDPTSQQQERRETSDGSDAETSGRTTPAEPRRKRYRVRPGDTLALIAERTGVTVEELLELNPDIDPNSLSVGEIIRLSE